MNELLHDVDYTNPQSALPSWVPDWRQPRQTVTLGGRTSSYAVYSAAGDNQAIFSIGDNKYTELNIPGTFFDTICHLSRVFNSPDITNRNPLTENKDLLTCIELCEDLNEYPGSSTVFDAFWHTLVADKDDTGRRRSPDSFAEIFSLLLDESSGKLPTLPGQTYTTRQKQPEGKGKLTLGCHVPFVVRVSNGRTVRLVSECYVHGIMRGEVMHREGFSWETVTII